VCARASVCARVCVCGVGEGYIRVLKRIFFTNCISPTPHPTWHATPTTITSTSTTVTVFVDIAVGVVCLDGVLHRSVIVDAIPVCRLPRTVSTIIPMHCCIRVAAVPGDEGRRPAERCKISNVLRLAATQEVC
jgi:hypothetical protein